MYKMRIVLASFALLAAQQVFADPTTPANSTTTAPAATNAPGPDASADNDAKPCRAIAEACRAAGFERRGAPDKGFWKDCMKPIMLGQTVAGVTLDPATVKACRVSKIQKIKAQLQELQSVSQ